MSFSMATSWLIRGCRDARDRRRVHLNLTDRGQAINRPPEKTTHPLRRVTGVGSRNER
jgi:hypothetical protein